MPPQNSDKPDRNAHDAGRRQVPIHRYDRAGHRRSALDWVVCEQRIELILNDQPLLAMLCLPQDVAELAVGFLYCEGILAKDAELPDVSYDAGTGRVRCQGRFDEDLAEQINRRWVLGTGCGGGGTARDLSVLTRYRPLRQDLSVTHQQLTTLARDFQGHCQLYRQTGGVHACALATGERVLLFAEDVGRHNAFDKVIGMALRQGMDFHDKLALTTGRITTEIVTKAVAAGIQLLASSSAATGLAIDLARKFNLTLVGFLRGQRMNIYTASARITTDNPTSPQT